MKRLVFLFIVSLMAHYSALAETILPFVQDGKVWVYYVSNFIYDWEETFSLEGDTLIGTRNCLKLYYTCQVYGQEHVYRGAMFYKSSGNVYFIAPGSTTPVLMYDFTSEPGAITDIGPFELEIKAKKIAKYHGEYLKVIDYSPIEGEGFEGQWIDGVGIISGGNLTQLVEGNATWATGGERQLKTCTVNGEVVFEWNDFYTSSQIVTSQEPLPFLEGNPIWVYKHEHLSRGTAWKDEVCYGCFVDTNDKKYNYYFLGGQKEIEGKVYTMMGEVKNDGENDLAVSRWLPVREENGIVYAFTDSLPGLIDYDYLEPPYLQQGNECVLYNFSAEIGDLLYPQKDYTKVESYGTYQLMDGIVCRVLKTTIEEFDLYEKLGYLHNGLYNGVMDPPSDLIYSTGGDVYASHLNAYFGNDMMLYKAPDAQEGLCVNDTCWTRDDAEAYAPSYKPDPRQEEVFSYIRQLQKGTGVTSPIRRQESSYFDLQGRKLSAKPSQGIYIENGQIILIK